MKALNHFKVHLRDYEPLAVYFAPLLLLYLVDVPGLWYMHWSLWGMYGNTDGMWAAWNAEAILQ